MFVEEKATTMEEALLGFKNAIIEDYLGWTTRCTGSAPKGELSDINKKMISEFNEKITYKEGSKYIKFFSEGGSVHSFVVNTDKDKKFKKGDILKAAGYSAPARNFARGNILAGKYEIRWTGA
ncbi:MAG TPA: hypothetical protein EYQ21_00050 [Flavobacteriales bacterium]|jgi:hypothetical protein|nr:hypothetical protein [Flavobacteriales bacterium]